MPTAKPTITPEHHERFQEIMKTPTRPNAPSDTTTPTPSKVSALLASLPKPKGVGNKMFIFTGKKKIVLEPGGEKEVENVKTVDAKAQVKKPNEVKTEAKKDEKSAQPSTITTAAADGGGNADKKDDTAKSGGAKAFLVVALIIFLGAWAIFLLYFLEFI